MFLMAVANHCASATSSISTVLDSQYLETQGKREILDMARMCLELSWKKNNSLLAGSPFDIMKCIELSFVNSEK